MAGSFMARLRERMEQLQTELQPEAAGFDRRAPAGPRPPGARLAGAGFGAAANARGAPGGVRFRSGSADGGPVAASEATPLHHPLGKRLPAPGLPDPRAPAFAPRPTIRSRGASAGATRARRLRARLRQPESLRELFLLREVIDRPIALRRRSRGR